MRRLPHITPLPEGLYQCRTPDGCSATASSPASAFVAATWMSLQQQEASKRPPPRGGLKPSRTVTIDRELLQRILAEPKDQPGDGILRFGSAGRSLRDRITYVHND